MKSMTLIVIFSLLPLTLLATDYVSLLKACNMNDYQACNKLAIAYYNGIPPITKNFKMAAYFFEKAFNGNVENACSSIAFSLLADNPTKQDVAKAIKIRQELCNKGALSKCNLLALTYMQEKEYKKAISTFNKACNQGNGASCEELVNLFQSNNKEIKPFLNLSEKDIITLLKKGCDIEVPSASACVTLLTEKEAFLNKDEITKYSFIACKHAYHEHCRDDDPEAKQILDDWLSQKSYK